MFFIDGENLVFRFQEMVKKGREPASGVVHDPDIFVWHQRATICRQCEIVRATYYTSAVAAPEALDEIRDRIQKLNFDQPHTTGYGGNLSASIFKKDKCSQKSKGVDIQLTTDLLTHSLLNHLDIAFLITGDADFVPVIEQVKRHGKQVQLLGAIERVKSETCSRR